MTKPDRNPLYRGRDPKLKARAQAALHALRSRPVYGPKAPTLADVVDHGIAAEVARLELRYGNGGPFPEPPMVEHRGRPRILPPDGGGP